MRGNAWLRYQRLRHPAATGAAEAAVAAIAGLFARGLAGPMIAAPASTVLLWAALAYRRAPAYQVAAAIVLALGCDLLSGGVAGASLAPLGAGMLAANLWAGRSGSRWDRAHAAFAGAALAGTLAAEITLGNIPSFGRAANSLLLLIAASAVLAAIRLWRSRHPRAARGRFPLQRHES